MTRAACFQAILMLTSAPGALAFQAQLAKLEALDGQVNDQYGLTASFDGDTAVIGASDDDDLGPQSGSAYAYLRFEGTWVQEAKLRASDGQANDKFGNAVAADGLWAAICAPGKNAGAGAVYIFKRTGVFPFSTWNEKESLTPSVPGPSFAYSVSMSGDTLAVGDPDLGVVYVFKQLNNLWTEVTILHTPVPNNGTLFGTSVSAKGDLIAVGAPNDDEVATNAGAVYVFRDMGGSWTEEDKLLPNNSMNPVYFGLSVSVDADKVAFGSYFALNGAGSAYIFKRTGSVWQEDAYLTASDGLQFDYFALSLSLLGSTIVIGAPYKSQAVGSSVGTAYVFEDSGSGWIELGQLHHLDPSQPDAFGYSVALSDDTVLVGATSGDGSAPDTGAAYVFSLSPPTPMNYCTAKVNSEGCTPSMSFQGVPSATDPLTFDVGATMVLNNKSGLLFYGTTAKAAVPFQGGLLCTNPPLKRTPVQSSGGNPPPNDCSGVFFFDFNGLVQSGANPSLVAGQAVYAQYWYRDPGVASTTGLTDGLEFVIGF